MKHPDYDLIAFDVDGTLVGSPESKVIWELLNDHFCPDAQINRQRFDAFLRREITYEQWVALDIQGWQQAGATRTEICHIIDTQLRLLPGAAETVHALKGAGYHLAVISGTLDLTLDLLFADHPFDVVFTNQIRFDERGQICGFQATPYDMDGKAHALAQIASAQGIPLNRTVFVGDNVNDLAAMRHAGLAIAFEPKDTSVSQTADHCIYADLRHLLTLLVV